MLYMFCLYELQIFTNVRTQISNTLGEICFFPFLYSYFFVIRRETRGAGGNRTRVQN